MNLKNIFQDFNPSKFLVFTCLLLFSLLFALRLDNTIEWSYWVIFLPIWIWKIFVIAGASLGSYIWWKRPQYRMEHNSHVQFKAMVICTGMHLLLLMFEFLACNNLEAETHSWILVFIPLMFLSLVSIGICIWAVKNDRSFEMEFFCSVNILQFIFIALRLDKYIDWSWVIVFIPMWIVMCTAMIGVLYVIIFAIITVKSPDIIPQHRRGNISIAIGNSFIVVPLLIFEVLLANRLDGDNHFKYTAITVPLFVSLITMICLSFGSKGGNQWWFGMRKDFCQFLLGVCPFLQEYGNISYSLHKNRQNQEESTTQTTTDTAKKYKLPDVSKVVVPVISIETPD